MNKIIAIITFYVFICTNVIAVTDVVKDVKKVATESQSTQSENTEKKGTVETQGLASLRNKKDGENVYSQEVFADRDNVVVFGKIKLEVPAGAVVETTIITIEKLSNIDTLNPGMCNVTNGAEGFRFTPSVTFKKDIKITLPFDKNNITSEWDYINLFTYFFNETASYWDKLKKEGIDRDNAVIISSTNHFTDMINSTLKLPESPSPLSFNPNSIKDIKAANPIANIPQIDGLSGNQRGVANFSLPLTLPAGRGGMQPGLAISYNSEGGNGWLGTGFDLQIPSITIDTRFGLPEYNNTDVYLLAGEKLLTAKTIGNDVYYMPKVEGGFNQIIRKGTGPGNYFFEITDKNGCRYYYGNDSAKLVNDRNSNIFIWYLSKVIDINGNTIKYNYSEDNNNGRDLYLSEIKYTGIDGIEEGKYRVVFENEGRDDVIIECRGKFIHKTQKRLKNIRVYYGNELIRRYGLEYIKIFGKSKVSKIKEYDSENKEFYSYDFEYYQMEKDGNDFVGFTDVQEIGDNLGSKPLERNHSFGGGASCYVGIGGGYGYGAFNFSAGLNIGFNTSYNYDSLKFMDINGDGLPDTIRQQTIFNPLYCKLNEGDGFSDDVNFSGITTPLNSGLQVGFDIGASGSIPMLSGSLGVSFNWVWSTSGFADVDADGFVDFIPFEKTDHYLKGTGKGFEKVYFQSTGTDETLTADISGMEKLNNAFHLTDPVRKWRPYHKGTVVISGTAEKIDNPDSNKESDGVKLNIYRNNESLLTNMDNSDHQEYWNELLNNNQSEILNSILLKDTGESRSHSIELVIENVKEEQFYFKASSIKNIDNDLVNWRQKISYSNIYFYDNLADCYNYNKLPGQFTFNDFKYIQGKLAEVDAEYLENFYILGEYEPHIPDYQKVYIKKESIDQANQYKLLLLLEEAEYLFINTVSYNGDKSFSIHDDTNGYHIPRYFKPEADNDCENIIFSRNSTIMGEGSEHGMLIDIEEKENEIITRKWIKDNGTDVYLIIEDLSNDQIITKQAGVSAGISCARNSDATNDILTLKEKSNGCLKTYTLKNHTNSIDTFKLIDLNIYENHFTKSTRDVLDNYYTKNLDGDYELNDELTEDNINTINSILLNIGIVNYDWIEKELFIYSDILYNVTEENYTGHDEVEVSNKEFEDNCNKEWAGYIYVEDFDEDGNTIFARQYIHVFDSANDFSPEVVKKGYSVKIPDTMTNIKYFENLSYLMDNTNDKGSFTENSSFFKKMYIENDSDYVLNSELLYEPYKNNITNKQKLQEVLYRLGYGSEYFAGGVYNWYYGQWNGDKSFHEDKIGIVNETEEVAYFGAMGSMKSDFSESSENAGGDSGGYDYTYENKIGVDIWKGDEFSYKAREHGQNGDIEEKEKYFLCYVTDDLWCPCRKGGDSKEQIPGQKTTVKLNEMDGIRRSFSVAGNYSASLSILSFIGSNSFVRCEKDFFDINGDRYPDRIEHPMGGTLRAYHNDKGRGFKSGVNYDNTFNDIRATYTDTIGIGVALSTETVGTWHKLSLAANGNVKSAENKKAKFSAGGGVNGSLGFARTTIDWIDINGDGLTDQVQRDAEENISVKLNVGDDFITTVWKSEGWTKGLYNYDAFSDTQMANVIRHDTTMSGNMNVSAGFDYFSGNASVGVSGTKTKVDFIDMNGDGLPDQVMKLNGTPFRVKLNLGDRFGDEQIWQAGEWGTNLNEMLIKLLENVQSDLASVNGGNGYTNIDFSAFNNPEAFGEIGNDINVSGIDDVINYRAGFNVSIGVTGTIPIPLGPLPITLFISPGGNFAYGMTSAKLQLTDFDGDGLPDHILKADWEDCVRVKLNNAKKVGLLKKIITPQGGTISLDYSKTRNSVDMPNAQWVLSGVTMDNNMGDSYTTKYDYADSGYYDRSERMSYGYDYLKTINPDGSTIGYYENRDYYKKGLLKQSETYSSDDKLFLKTVNTYNEKSFGSAKFYYLAETKKYIYDRVGSRIETITTFTCDNYGNVTGSVDKGNPATTDDDIYINITYEYDQTRYIMANPVKLTVTDNNGTILRQREGDYDTKGRLRTHEQYLENGTNPITTIEYDDYGNIEKLTDPAGYYIKYTYDDVLHTYMTKIEDAFGYTSTAEYGYKLGVDKVSTDTNNNKMTKEYDSFGRLKKVFTSYDTTIPAVEFFYFNKEFPARAVTKNKVHFDQANNETLDTVIVIDGMGRVLETKKEGEVSHGGTEDTEYGMVVSGKIVYDNMGRVWKQGQHLFEVSTGNLDINDPDSLYGYYPQELKIPTITEYDPLGRVIKTTLPDNSIITNDYLIVNNLFKITVTDPNNKRKISYSDIHENIIKIEQFNKGKILATNYNYNLLGEILKVIDTKNFTTSITYDTLGRRLSINNPDAGLVEYEYSTSGDLISKVDNNLREAGKQIKYEYDYHRLKKIDYPVMTDVTYEYGIPNAPNNRAGRITKITDESGEKSFYYGKLGEQVKIDMILNSLTPAEDPSTFTEEYRYDYLGRAEWIHYADDETVFYEYNKGGEVNKVYSKKDYFANGVTTTVQYDYVKALNYDQFGQRVYIKYGNDVETKYIYDPNRRWLSNINTKNINNKIFQDVDYGFDKVGNIHTIENKGYKYCKQTYQYDDLYQLTKAEGTYIDKTITTAPKTYKYNQSYSYDDIGNLTKKISKRTVSPHNPNPGLMNYSFNYKYNSSKPHQLKDVGIFKYHHDANGNMTKRSNTKQNDNTDSMYIDTDFYDPVNQTDAMYIPKEDQEKDPDDVTSMLFWNEENRLTAVDNAHGRTKFLYDSTGERTVKREKFTEIVYISKYTQLKDKEMYTKHVYLGNSRLVTKVCSVEDDFNDIEFEKRNQYFVHGDHLGSASWITDYQGKEYRLLINSPYGETFVEQGDKNKKIGYSYVGKEKDDTTGYHYYSARYYDSQLSQFITVDPALIDGTYFDTNAGLGGIYNPANVNGSYIYCANNPTKYTDPTGKVLTVKVYNSYQEFEFYSVWIYDDFFLHFMGAVANWNPLCFFSDAQAAAAGTLSFKNTFNDPCFEMLYNSDKINIKNLSVSTAIDGILLFFPLKGGAKQGINIIAGSIKNLKNIYSSWNSKSRYFREKNFNNLMKLAGYDEFSLLKKAKNDEQAIKMTEFFTFLVANYACGEIKKQGISKMDYAKSMRSTYENYIKTLHNNKKDNK